MFKLSNFLLLLFIIFTSFQAGLHFWPPESYLSGLRLDYLSPTIYLSDLIGLLYLLLSLKNKQKFHFSIAFTIGIILFTRFNFFWTAKIIIYQQLFLLLLKDKAFLRSLKLGLIISLFFLFFLSAAQFLSQKSLGGVFAYFGERPLGLSQPHVAKVSLPLLGQSLRAYATFPHPNSLAGYLLICLVLLGQLGTFPFITTLVVFCIFLTFSKAGLLALLILALNIKTKDLIVVSLIGTTLLFILPTTFSSSLNTRAEFLHIALNSQFFQPIGLGLHGYLRELSSYLPAFKQNYENLQPVHNSFLLALIELGPFLLLACFLYVKKSLYKYQRSMIYDLLSILIVTGSLDHYWWTLQQNQLIIFVSFIAISQYHALSRNYHQH